MKRVNGWQVYLKIKELKNEGQELHINSVVTGLGITEELAREYLTALSVLQFIRFTDDPKDQFELTDLGRDDV